MIFPSGTEFLVEKIREPNYIDIFLYEIEITIPLYIKKYPVIGFVKKITFNNYND